MGPRKISFSEAQRRYDNLTPETINRFPRRKCRVIEDDDDGYYDSEEYYHSKEFSRIMDAYEKQFDGP